MTLDDIAQALDDADNMLDDVLARVACERRDAARMRGNERLAHHFDNQKTMHEFERDDRASVHASEHEGRRIYRVGMLYRDLMRDD